MPRYRPALPILSLCIILALQGCSGGGDDESRPPVTETPAQAKPAASVRGEPVGANCPLAGRAVIAGLDTNTNGVLDTAEVTSTQYLCNLVNAAPGVTGVGGKQILVVMAAEPAGANCSAGGTRVDTGLDDDGDAALAPGEIMSSAYVCGGGTPLRDLAIAAVEPPGSPCVNGGNRVVSGRDANANTVLDSGEMSAPVIVCDAVPSSNFPWSDTFTDLTMADDQGYLAATPTMRVFTLPASPAIGAQFRVAGTDSGGWTIAQQAGQRILLSVPGAATWPGRAAADAWQAVTSSADGAKLVAVANLGQIHTSTDYGLTWTPRATSQAWFSVASSANGVKLVAVVLGGQIYTSADSGATWTPRDSARDWVSVASSADGTRLVAAVLNGNLYTSADSGATWVARAASRTWTSVASSADGMSLAATDYGGRVYTSTDAGATWTARESARNWFVVASSADGSKLVAAVQNGRLYTSTDAGATWFPRESARQWSGLTSSADGTQLAAATLGGQLYTSANAGVTWSARESGRSWVGITSSADGSKIVAVAQNDFIRTSFTTTTSGATGSVVGTLNEAIELEYRGGGVFEAVRLLGNLVVN